MRILCNFNIHVETGVSTTDPENVKLLVYLDEELNIF